MGAFSCGIAYVTSLSVEEVEKWLEKKCPGDWTIQLADDDGSLPPGKRKIEVLFEKREDLDTFKGEFKAHEAQRSSGEKVPHSAATKPDKKGTPGMLRPDRKRR